MCKKNRIHFYLIELLYCNEEPNLYIFINILLNIRSLYLGKRFY